MGLITIHKTSLFSDTLRALRATLSEWWPWVLIFGLMIGGMQYYYLNSPIANSELLEQYVYHPETVGQSAEDIQKYFDFMFSYLKLLTIYLTGATIIQGIAFYVFAVIAMRYVLSMPNLAYSWSSFANWGTQISVKYLRPILWLFIPVIGIIPFMRSVLRSSAVTPLALLQSGQELTVSWHLTEGKCWTLLLNQIGVTLFIGGVAWMGCLVIVDVLYVLTGGVQNHAFMGLIAILQGIWIGIVLVTMALYCVVSYRYLQKENNVKMTLPAHGIV